VITKMLRRDGRNGLAPTSAALAGGVPVNFQVLTWAEQAVVLDSRLDTGRSKVGCSEWPAVVLQGGTTE
jgi:hypothetical protein